MKKTLVIALCFVVLSLSACSAGKAEHSEGSSQGESTNLPNPFVPCDTVKDAETLAGFSIALPQYVSDNISSCEISAVENNMIQLVCKADGREIMLRKAVGSDDISGDYNAYEKTETIKVGEQDVTFKGNGTTVSVAFWSDGDSAYSIQVGFEKDGLDREFMEQLVSGLK